MFKLVEYLESRRVPSIYDTFSNQHLIKSPSFVWAIWFKSLLVKSVVGRTPAPQRCLGPNSEHL